MSMGKKSNDKPKKKRRGAERRCACHCDRGVLENTIFYRHGL